MTTLRTAVLAFILLTVALPGQLRGQAPAKGDWSVGILLFTNDTRWAAGVLSPASHLETVYHVQVAGLPEENDLQRLTAGIADGGQVLAAGRVRELRLGQRNCWLEIALDEG